jgi:hypothetical protein
MRQEPWACRTSGWFRRIGPHCLRLVTFHVIYGERPQDWVPELREMPGGWPDGRRRGTNGAPASWPSATSASTERALRRGARLQPPTGRPTAPFGTPGEATRADGLGRRGCSGLASTPPDMAGGPACSCQNNGIRFERQVVASRRKCCRLFDCRLFGPIEGLGDGQQRPLLAPGRTREVWEFAELAVVALLTRRRGDAASASVTALQEATKRYQTAPQKAVRDDHGGTGLLKPRDQRGKRSSPARTRSGRGPCS